MTFYYLRRIRNENLTFNIFIVVFKEVFEAGENSQGIVDTIKKFYFWYKMAEKTHFNVILFWLIVVSFLLASFY